MAGERQVTVGIRFDADFSAADAAWKAKLAEYQSRTITLPAGMSSATLGPPATTLSGLTLPSSAGLYGRNGNGAAPGGAALPSFDAESAQVKGGMTTLARALYAQAATVRDTTNQIRGGGGSAVAGDTGGDVGGGASEGSGGGRSALSRLYTRLGRAGGFLFAYRGLEAAGRQYARYRELDETLQYEGPDAAARLSAQQTREDRSNLISSSIRSGAVLGTRGYLNLIGRTGIYGRVASIVGGAVTKDLLTDPERDEQDRVNASILEAKDKAAVLREGTRGLRRQAGTIGLDPISRQAAEAQLRFADAEDRSRELQNRANELDGKSPGSGKELRDAAKDNLDAAGRVRDAMQAATGVSRVSAVNALIADTGVSAARGRNDTIGAARIALNNETGEQVRQAIATRNPLLPLIALNALVKRTGFESEVTREADLSAGSLSDSNNAAELRLRRQPLQARLATFVGGVRDRYRSLSSSPENDAERAQLRRELAVGQEQIQQDYGANQTLQNIRFGTQERQLKLLLNRNPLGAEAAGIAGGALEQAEHFVQAGEKGNARTALQLGLGRLDVEHQQYLDQFRGAAVDLRHFDVSNPRDADKEQKVVEAVNEAKETITQAIKDMGSD